MAVKNFKPTTPGRRFMTVSRFDEITKGKPEKSLLAPLKKFGGRNNTGRITVRHRGGGHKRRYRIIDFKRINDPPKWRRLNMIPTAVRGCPALCDGEKRYILAPDGGVGDSGFRTGCRYQGRERLPLANIPVEP